MVGGREKKTTTKNRRMCKCSSAFDLFVFSSTVVVYTKRRYGGLRDKRSTRGGGRAEIPVKVAQEKKPCARQQQQRKR